MNDQDSRLSNIEHNGHTWALDERNPPHVIKDGEDNGVAIQGEEALWSEVVSLRQQLRGAVDPETLERHRWALDAAVRFITENGGNPDVVKSLLVLAEWGQ
jgi:hypothetical protein